jgi:hypothetical protein
MMKVIECKVREIVERNGMRRRTAEPEPERRSPVAG